MNSEELVLAIEHILSTYQDGALIPNAELRQILHWQAPQFNGDEEEFLEAVDNAKLAWLSATTHLRKVLLKDYRIALRTIHRDGYQIVPAPEQTRFASEASARSIKKAMSWAKKTLTHIRLDSLSQEERRANADALARLSHLRQVFAGRAE